MKILFITHNLIPHPTGFGSAIHVWSIINSMAKNGHDVHLISYGIIDNTLYENWAKDEKNAKLDLLKYSNIQITLFLKKTNIHYKKSTSIFQKSSIWLNKVLFPKPIDYYAGPLYKDEIQAVIDQFNPDAISAYTSDAVSSTVGIKNIPRLASVVDLDHLARKYRSKYQSNENFKQKLLSINNQILNSFLYRVEINLLKNCDLVYEHAYHHFKWLTNKSVSNMKYLPVAVLDYAKEQIENKKKTKPNLNSPIKIILIGKTTGVATKRGLYYFANNVLPAIAKIKTDRKYEFHVIGGDTLPKDLQATFKKFNIKIRGFVENISEELISCDILFVPTPMDLGFRTRISEGFSYGCCTVAHKANSAGMPELIHNQNILLGTTGKELANNLIECVESVQLREKLGNEARKTFEKKYDGKIIADEMISDLSRVVSEFQINRGI
jgi:glycosyltransferase involved in cell wall biosynthesis